MRRASVKLAILLDLLGLVWLLQGVGILGGSRMTGQPFWAFAGVVCLLASSALYLYGLRRRPT
jgi:hypothetical protein